MNRTIAIATLVAAGWLAAADLSAQNASSSQPSSRSKPAAPVTLTGCIERADQVVDRALLATTVDSLTFVLVKAESPSATKPTGTAGATAPSEAPRDAAPTMYRLDADVAKLNPHVGHKVEVVGAPPAPAVPGEVPTVKVESVKMLSDTCAR
jgi:hypothetical protein